MTKISVVISAYNEEEKIKDCLDSIKNLASEIIFVDNSSSDKTSYIAKRYTNKVFIRKNNLMLNVNKNYGFLRATGDWILSLDADERVTAELGKEIREKIQNSIWWPDYQLRLFRNGKGKFPEKHVHEYLSVDGKTEQLKNPLDHINYTSISQYIYKMDKIYTESEVENILSKGGQLVWIDAVRMPASDFLKTFFAQKGYKDGLHGLVLSILQAFYAEIVFAKVWERQGFRRHNSPAFLEDIYKEFSKITQEFKYWFLSSMMEMAKNPLKKAAYKFKRKILHRKISA